MISAHQRAGGGLLGAAPRHQEALPGGVLPRHHHRRPRPGQAGHQARGLAGRGHAPRAEVPQPGHVQAGAGAARVAEVGHVGAVRGHPHAGVTVQHVLWIMITIFKIVAIDLQSILGKEERWYSRMVSIFRTPF